MKYIFDCFIANCAIFLFILLIATLAYYWMFTRIIYGIDLLIFTQFAVNVSFVIWIIDLNLFYLTKFNNIILMQQTILTLIFWLWKSFPCPIFWFPILKNNLILFIKINFSMVIAQMRIVLISNFTIVCLAYKNLIFIFLIQHNRYCLLRIVYFSIFIERE